MIVIAYAEGLLTDEEFRVSSSEVGSTSIPDEFSSSRILRLNFSLINLNRSLTDRLFTRNLAVSQVLRWFEISSQILPLSTVLSLNLYGWQTSISRQRRRSCSSFHSMLANPVNKEKADKQFLWFLAPNWPREKHLDRVDESLIQDKTSFTQRISGFKC